MKKLLTTLFLCLFVTSNYAQKASINQPNNGNSVGLQNALDEIEKVTDEIKSSYKIEGTFDVTVKFNNVVTDESGFELKIFFFTIKKSRNKSIDNSFAYKYTFSSVKKQGLTGKKLELDMAKTLISGIESYQKATSESLKKNGFDLTVSFTMEKGSSGSVSVPILEPITVGANKGRKKKSIHTVTINFKPEKNKEPSEQTILLKKSNELVEKIKIILESQKKDEKDEK